MSELSFNGLIGAIKSVDSHFCESAVRAVNVGLTLRNWCIGAYVAEFELYGEEKAKYGEKLFERISQSLKDLGMRRCDVCDLRRYVLFYERYPEIEKILPDSVREQYLSVCSGAELKSGSEQNIEIQGIRETLSPEFILYKFTVTQTIQKRDIFDSISFWILIVLELGGTQTDWYICD